MEGIVFNYTGTSLSVNTDMAIGSGTYNDWVITLAGNIGATGATGVSIQGASGATGATGPQGNGISSANWTIVESGGVLYFKYQGVNMFKIDASGNLTAAANITAYGTV